MSLSASRSMPGTQPTVEIVVRRWVMPTSGSRRAAASTWSRFIIGSPIPMNTRWSTGSMRRKCSTWSRISLAVRLRPNFIAPGRAERARQRAARLRGDADGAAAVAVAHQHGLDGAAVVGVEQRLDRAVGGVRLVDELERGERHLGGQPLAQRGGQVGHLVVAARAVGRPAPHLAGAEGGLAGGGQRRSSRQASQVHARLWWQADAPRQVPRPRRRGLAPRLRAARVRGPGDRRAARSCATRRATSTAARGSRSTAGRRARGRATAPSTPSTSPPASSRPRRTRTGARRSSSWSRAARRLYPVGPPGRGHHRADPAHRRRPARPPAHASRRFEVPRVYRAKVRRAPVRGAGAAAAARRASSSTTA